ncbi:MAG: S8 family serine peptidase [Bacillota bacterium]|nr:S8 family serine peptidase [Bacillota bacterium]
MKRSNKALIKVLIILVIALSVTILQFTNVFAAGKAQNTGRDKKEILVKYKDDSKADSVRASIKSKFKLNKLDSKRKFRKSKMELVRIGDKDNVDSVVKDLRNDPNVEYAQPNYQITISSLPNDTDFAKQWGLSNNGQTIQGQDARSGVDVDVSSAWDTTQGSSSVVVGVLDTGIDIGHEDLAKNIYVNDKENTGSKGVDDDGNGYIDDLNGWNFVDGNNQVYDPSADTHGTEVAGIIAAVNSNTTGISGVAPNVKILPLKFINGTIGYTSDAIDAINYAMSMGVKIINCSFSASDNNLALKDAMQNSGILFVCSAGNTGANVTQTPTYPANFGLSNLISVAAIDGKGVLANFSTYGSSIDVAAPGVNILTTTPDGYDYLSGTSASAPFVTGEAALLLSNNPGMSISDVKSRIISNVKKCNNLVDKVSSGGRIDINAALTNTPPSDIDTYSGAGWKDITFPGEQQSKDADSWYTTDQLAKVKQQIHYGESGVSPTTGNFSFTVNDMSVVAPGFTVDISRTYNSGDDRTSPFGRGWTFGFQGSAIGINDTSDMVVATLPTGAVERFVHNSDGSYTANDSRSQFVRNSDGSYTLTTKDQYTYHFNTNGYLDWMKDRNGNAVYITVDSTGKVSKITDQAGRDYSVAYGSNGLISQISDPSGRIVKYEYTSNLLTKVTDPEGKLMNYSYDAQGYLTEITDNDNKKMVSLVYDHTINKVKQATDASGDTSVYTYDTTNSKTSVNENDGARTWIYKYDSSYYITEVQDPEGRTAKTDYVVDANGKNKFGDVKTQTDRYGNSTSYARDAQGNVLQATNPDGSSKTYNYDDKNNLTMEKDENGRTTFYIFDSSGKQQLLKIQPIAAGVNYSLTTGKDSNGNYSFTIKDNNNNIVLQGQPENGKITYTQNFDLSKFAITQYTYYTDSEMQQMGCKAIGLLKEIIDPEGGETIYTYDANGYTATITDPEKNVTTIHYNSIGWKKDTKSPGGFVTNYDYNNNGLLTETTLQDGSMTKTVYDAMGRKTEDLTPNQNAQKKDGTKYTYYDDGSLKTATDSLGHTTTYTYDKYGNKLTEKEDNGSVYLYDYDNMNRLVKVSFKESSTAEPVVLTEYSYAVLSNNNTQTTETKYLNSTDKAVTVTTNDYAGRTISQQNPDGTVIKTGYNDNGTVKTTTDANGSVTYYYYDGLNRLTQQYTPFENINGTTLYTYTKIDYDKNGNKISEQTGKEKVQLDSLPSSYVSTYYTYFKNGKLKSQTDSSGKRIDYEYDGDGNVSKQEVYTDSSNCNVTEFTYNQQGKVLTKTVHVKSGDISGNDIGSSDDKPLTTNFTYDNDGNLLTATTHDNITTTYAYDIMDQQTSVSQPGTDETGAPATISTSTTYDWEGKPLTTTDANNNTTTYVYDARGQVLTVTDAKGGITAYYYDLAGRKIAEVSPQNYDKSKTLDQMSRVEYTYDSMGRVLTKLDKYADPVTSKWVTLTTKKYSYDKNGNVVEEQDALGVENGYDTEYTYNLANKPVTVTDPVTAERGLPYTTKYDYDALGRKTSETNAKGVVASYTYDDAGNLISAQVNGKTVKSAIYDYTGNVISQTDGNGNTTTYDYNAMGKVRRTVLPGDATIPGNTVNYQYDVMGNLVYTSDSTGKVTLYTYDNQGRPLTKTEQAADGTQAITTSVKYDKNGNKRFTTDGNGTTTENTYDQLNRLISSTITVSGVQEITSYTYDKNGNQLTVTDWRGNTTTNVYDPLNRVIEKDDAYGKVIQKIEYNDVSIQTASYDALGNETDYTYDDNNRLIATTDAEKHTTSQTYDNVGNISTKTDGNGISTTYTYDELNRLISVTDPKSEVTSYTYDLNGNLLTQKDGNGNITTFQYNAGNKVIKKLFQKGKPESYTHNADGSLATKTDRNGKTTAYTYDIHGRLLSQTIGQAAISYTYDNNGNQLTMTDSTGTTTRTYDELNRVLIKEVPVIGKSTYSYDITAGVPDGCTAETSTDPKGNVTTKVYDKVGRLISVTAEGKTTTYEYYDNGNRKSVIYPDGSREDYTYYKDNLNETLVNTKADGNAIDSYSYTYDGAHNQTSKTDAKGTTKYTYDSLNRLQTVTDPSGIVTSYTYDKAGNRLSETVTSGDNIEVTVYTYDALNRLLNTTTITSDSKVKVTYTYDNNGNMLSSSKVTIKAATPGKQATAGISAPGQSNDSYVTFYSYDVWNQLIKTTVGSQTITYTYNGDGLRVSKTVNGQTTNYLYEYSQVVLETDGSGNQTAKNVYGTNLLSRTAGADTYYYMYNGHADVTALIKPDGTIAATYYYDAFGNIVNTTGSANNSITFAGYQYDSETGLYYLNARYYDPATARFLSEDTVTGDPNDPLSLNLYTYCHNEPIMYMDPTGHIAKGDDKYTGLTSEIIRDATDAYYKASDAYDLAKNCNDKEGMQKAKQAMTDAHTLADDARKNADKLVNSGDEQFYDKNQLNIALSNGNVSRNNWENMRSSDHTGKGNYAVTEYTSSTDIYNKDSNRINDYKPVSYAYYLNSRKDAGGFGHAAILLQNSEGSGTYYTYFTPDAQDTSAKDIAKTVLGKDFQGVLGEKFASENEINNFLNNTGKFNNYTFMEDNGKTYNGGDGIAYDRYLVIPVDTVFQGIDMVNTAETIYKDKSDKYNLYSHNCNMVAQTILASGGLNFTGTSASMKDVAFPIFQQGLADILGVFIDPIGTFTNDSDAYTKKIYKSNWDMLGRKGIIPNSAFEIGSKKYTHGYIPKMTIGPKK